MSGKPNGDLLIASEVPEGELAATPPVAECQEARVLDRLNANSALPAHLQGRSFDRDLWDRVRSHPVRNPTLSKTKLDDDVDTREIVRQVMAAANEREKEVLLHNQTRVFREVLGRVFDTLGAFLSRPLIPAEWVTRTIRPSDAGAETNPKPTESMAKRILMAMVTPQYIFLTLGIMFAAFAGYKQIQVQNLRDAIESYKLSAASTDAVRNEMKTLVENIETERVAWTKKEESQNVELARLRTDHLEATQTLAAIEQQLIGAKDENVKLKGSLLAYQDKQSDDVKQLQGKYDVAEAARQKLETDLAATRVRNESLSKEIDSLNGKVAELQEFIKQRETELDGVRKNYSDQFTKRAALENQSTILRFAESALYNIRQEANGFGGMNKDRVRQYLQEFDSAKQTVVQPTQ